MSKKILFGVVGMFTIMGILFSGILVHEGIHILQVGNAESLCIDLDGEDMAHIETRETIDNKLYLESIAYLITTLFLISALGLTFGEYYKRKYKR